MTEIQNFKPYFISKKNPKYVWVIEYWNLRFICNLVLGIWDFGFYYILESQPKVAPTWRVSFK